MKKNLWREYEREKAILDRMDLNPKEYEKALRELAKKYKI